MFTLHDVKQLIFLGTLICTYHVSTPARSPFRTPDPATPCVVTSWEKSPQEHHLFRNSRLEEHALFKTFDRSFFLNHQLPDHAISYRYQPHQHVAGTLLKKRIDELIDEIYANKKKFTHFTILKDGNFNYVEHLGLIVLKFHEYPFVLKVFMDHPKNLASPYAKGFAPLCCFYMGGGINRHLIGFTRVKNVEFIKQKLATNSHWTQKVDVPRKWFFLPSKADWIKLVGSHIGTQEHLQTSIPGTYCIIADAIETDSATSMFNKRDNLTCLDLCRFLEFAIDPHIDNFMWEKGTNKLVIIDTEHFHTMLGFREPKQFTSYFSWYSYLTGKFIHNAYFRSKSDLRELQMHPPLILL